MLVYQERYVPGKSLHLGVLEGDTQRIDVLKALASEPRLAILDYLGPQSVPLSQIAKKLGIPPSTAAMHVTALERAGLLRTDMTPASRGLQKMCARTYDEIVVTLPRDESRRGSRVEVSMPVGAYSEFEVEPTCGLAGATDLIGYLDDPASFYEPTRFGAQLLWFRRGFVEYRFPNRVPGNGRITAVQFAAELCSEAPRHNDDYPSDIGIWINGVHLGIWTSPGDFGGERGRLTPDWWESADSQYGLLKRWRVTTEGTTLDGVRLSNVTLDDVGLARGEPIRVRLGVARDAEHGGGINLFGERFGNYPQDLVLIVDYEPLGQRQTVGAPTVAAGSHEA
jgi:predicted transcriptional regulator